MYREAGPADAPAIAALHADSWRRNYRFAYPPSFFDESLDADRLAVWTSRLSPAAGSAGSAGAATIVADGAPGEGLAGFVHVRVEPDGVLVDNLHVRHDLQRQGIATALMRRAAGVAVAESPGVRLYLWVLEQNTRAQAFYEAIGGRRADRRHVDPPALAGVHGIRMVWPDPASLAAG